MAEKIVLVDGYSLLYRAFHALPLMDNGEGEYTNAIYGFMSMFLKVISEEKPEYCAVAFDEHAPTFRHLKYDAYKAGRAPTPEEMRPQIPAVREILGGMGIRLLSLAGYEADDILGTVSRICEEKGVDALIVTGDRDSYQLAGDRTSILYTKRGITDTERVTPAWINEKYGLKPEQLIDVKSLMGDASDNIPGVPGVGEKTAVKLINEYGTLENVLANAETGLKGALQARILENCEQARESRFLAEICRSVPLEFTFEDCRIGDFSGAIPIMRRYKLKSLIARLTEMGAEEKKAVPVSVKTEKRPIQAISGADALAEAIQSYMNNPPAAMAIHLGESFTLASSDGWRLSCEMGGDLLSPGLSDEEIVAAL